MSPNKTFKVTVRRIEHREHVFEVEAATEVEARLKSLDVSEDHDFDQDRVHYSDHEDIACVVAETFGVLVVDDDTSKPDKLWGPYESIVLADQVSSAHIGSAQTGQTVQVNSDTKFDARPALPCVEINYTAHETKVDARFAEAAEQGLYDFDLRKHITDNLMKQATDPLDAASCLEVDQLRASMTVVAQMLREAVRAWTKMKESVRYDDPPRIRTALDVHCLHLGDLALELEKPGHTKYSPNKG